MAAKNSTLVLKVNLDCRDCHKTIGNVIYNLQLEKVNIKTISYDKKNQTVTISGAFDPECLSKKLKCMTGRVIKNIQIKEEPKRPKTADKATRTGVHFAEDVLNAEKTKKHKPQLRQPERGDALKKPVGTADHDEPEAEAPRQTSAVKVPGVVPVIPYFLPPGGPVYGGGRPCWEGHHGGCTHWSCHNYGGVGYGVPYYPVPHKNLQFFCEEDQPTWCAMM